MRHPNNAAPTTRSGPPPQSPRHFKLFSPRQQSSKRNRAIALTKSTIIPLLMALIVLSSITNLYRLGGGGVDTDRAAASSDPTLQPQDGEQKRLVRHDKTARRNNDAVRVIPNDKPLVDSRTGGNNDLQSQKRQSSRRETAINGYNQEQNLYNENSQRRFSFRPHPTTEARRLSRSSHMALPKPTTSIKLNRSVCLDGKNVMRENNVDANLKNWLGEAVGNSSNDELGYRTQTVVWDHDDECVPMSTWQLTVHVSCWQCILSFKMYGVVHSNCLHLSSCNPKPTCNSLHELDISQLINEEAFSLVSSKGFWRNAWKVALVERPDETETANSSPDPPQPPPRILVRSEGIGESVKMHVVLKSIK